MRNTIDADTQTCTHLHTQKFHKKPKLEVIIHIYGIFRGWGYPDTAL